MISFPRQHARTRRFSLGAPRNLTMTRDGAVLFCRSDADDPITALWELGADDGRERMLFDPRSIEIGDADLPAAERARRERARESATGVVAYATDDAGHLVATVIGGSLVTIRRPDGAVAVLDTGGAVFDPRPSPDGRHIAAVRGNDLVVIAVDRPDVEPVVAARAEAEAESWGRAEFIAAEEMGRSRGFWWLADSTGLIVSRVDTSDVDEWVIADPARPDRAATTHRYPAAGTTNAAVELWRVPLGGDATRLDWQGDGEATEYLANVVVDDAAVRLVRQDRSQRLVEFATLAEDGVFRTDRSLRDPHWIELDGLGPARMTVGDRALEVTVEDLADRRALCVDGAAVTGPEIQVRRAIGPWSGGIVVLASRRPTAIEVALVRLDEAAGESEVEWLTDGGVASAVVGGERLAILRRRLETSGVAVEVHGPADRPVHSIASHAATPVLDAKVALPDGLPHPTAVLFPTDDPGGALPVLLDPYGGPHAQRVLEAHDAHLVSQWFADQGFVVVVTDGRGTPGRGPAVERAVAGDLAAPVLDDQIAALDAVAAAYPGRLDLDRVGIRGWSFGGYLAALAAIRRPDRIHAAIAGAPVTTWRLYDTHYTERYLGHPDLTPEAYDRTDLILEAGDLTRPLLLIHGLADDNVVAAHTLQLSSALLAAGRAHQVLPLSGVTHMTPQEVVAENLLVLQRDFLATHLRLESR